MSVLTKIQASEYKCRISEPDPEPVRDPDSFAEKFMSELLNTYGGTNFRPMFDVMHKCISDLYFMVSEHLKTERAFAKVRVEQAEQSFVDFTALLSTFGDFEKRAIDELNKQ